MLHFPNDNENIYTDLFLIWFRALVLSEMMIDLFIWTGKFSITHVFNCETIFIASSSCLGVDDTFSGANLLFAITKATSHPGIIKL